MKTKVLLLLMIVFILSVIIGAIGCANQTVLAESIFESVDIASAKVTANVLNIRQGPSTSLPIICKLVEGEIIKVFGKIDDWYAVYIPQKKIVGVAVSQYLQIINGQQSAFVPQSTWPSAQESVTTPLPDMSDEEMELLNYVNQERANKGIGALQLNAELIKLARLKANDMVNKGYFAHNSPTYGSPFDMMRQSGVSFSYAAENIAGNNVIKNAFSAWTKSQGHMKNILNDKFTYTGIGVVPSNVYGKITVQLFIGK